MAQVQESDAIKSRNELIAGMVAGFVCKLIEYPLDTVKVQVQTQSRSGPQIGPLAMLTKNIKTDGFFSLYRGLPSPLLGSMMENMVLFSSYAFAGRIISADPENQPFSQKLICGMFSGFCVASVLTPVELVKCRMQTSNAEAVKYKNSVQCIEAILKEGGPRGLFAGHVGTLCREVPGNAAWFGGYELGLYLQTPEGGDKKDIHPVGVAAAGALGGMSYWFFPFPFDVVKSKIQTGTHGLAPGSAVNVISVMKHIFATEGIKGLYRGCALTVGRAAPSNAVLFTAYEMTMRILRGQPMLGSA